jgi:hypothetical protein
MNRFLILLFLFLSLCAAQAPIPSLHGVITDPSGATVPGALVQLRGPGGEQRARTDAAGAYNFPSLRPGKYTVRVIAKGFTVSQRQNFEITAPVTLDAQLTIQAETQVVNVEDEAAKVSADPESNGTAIVLHEKELEALSDDPDELSQQLQAMAGPGGGPNGGQIYIDGFTGNNLPSKSSIREVRINTNPMSPEYDRPGFGRIEIFTRPGTDFIRGQAYFQYNKEALNSRSPLLTQSKRPPYQQKFAGLNLSGPLKKQKASFGFDFERRDITENAFLLATALDSGLNPTRINQALLTPQVRTTISPRLDYAITRNNNLTVRYQDTRSELDNEGVGGFNLASRAFNQKETENTIQATETMVVSPKAVNETRFQFMRLNVAMLGDNTLPAVNVEGAFANGGASIGHSSTINHRWELTNTTTYTKSTHTIKWGARLRQDFMDDTSVKNFGGTFTFFGGVGPVLNGANQPVVDPAVCLGAGVLSSLPAGCQQLSALDRYRRTLLFQQAGLSPQIIRLYGGGASQFSLSAGTPLTTLNQFDIGLFANDDWRIRPNLTLSYGLRYETQTNIRDLADFAPRVAVAWGVDGKGNKAAKTVLRAGFGVFYDRLADTITLAALRYNGVTQQSYLIQNPDFFPTIPATLTHQPQQLQLVGSAFRAPRNYQFSTGIDRQINSWARLGVQYIESRGVHLLRSRNINAPLASVFPYGDAGIRQLYEDEGFSRTHTMLVSPNITYKKMFFFGFYALSYGKDDNEGQPANPYNLRAEWGPSTFADVHNRLVFGTSVPVKWGISIAPFFIYNSGTAYNITTGLDTLDTGFTTERPALLAGTSQSACTGGSLVYAKGFGCFNLTPVPGTATIERNSGRGPGLVTLNLRLSRTWAFGNKGESGADNPTGMPPGMGGVRGADMGGRGGGPPGGGPPRGMFGATSGKKYNLMLSISARNVLNHANYAAPNGDLSSPFSGQSLSLAGFFGPFGTPTTYNRKCDVQLRFMF